MHEDCDICPTFDMVMVPVDGLLHWSLAKVREAAGAAFGASVGVGSDSSRICLARVAPSRKAV
jgi:hypothetical protein